MSNQRNVIQNIGIAFLNIFFNVKTDHLMAVRISLKCKCDLEESTSHPAQLAENDDSNQSGQSTVTVSGGEPEPPEPKTKTEKQLVRVRDG
jgi:hypothetical protein